MKPAETLCASAVLYPYQKILSSIGLYSKRHMVESMQKRNSPLWWHEKSTTNCTPNY